MIKSVTQANRKLLRMLLLVSVFMFGFGFALWPIYNIACQVLGIQGRVFQEDVSQTSLAPDLDRWVTIEFDSNTNSMLPWDFRPLTHSMKVHPGEINEAYFYAKNNSVRTITGQASYNVAPPQAALYFSKTECFCFTKQRLKGGEDQEMLVRFMLSPDLPEDVSVVTMSYTFFKLSTEPLVASSNASPKDPTEP